MENLASQIYESPEMTVAQMIEYKIGPNSNILKIFSCIKSSQKVRTILMKSVSVNESDIS